MTEDAQVGAKTGSHRVSSDSQVTLEDVARMADVSRATVSRYVNHPTSVREPKCDRIKHAIDALGYVPHGAARALASNRSRMIGACFPSLDSGLFGGTLESFQKELAKAGYTVVVSSSGYDEEQEAFQIRTLLQNGVDALLLVGAERSSAITQLLDSKRVPFVQTYIAEADNGYPCVGFDNREAASDLAEHLLSLGHREIAVISGVVKANDRARQRLAGIRDALASHGLPLPDHRVAEIAFGRENGRGAFNRLMSVGKRPTAVICGSEPFAYGALFEAQAMGLHVPKDVSIAGFDDMWLAAQLSPALTTVKTPRIEMGEASARYLLDRLSGTNIPNPQPLETHLIIRESTAPPHGSVRP